jgi:hypothetical protein
MTKYNLERHGCWIKFLQEFDSLRLYNGSKPEVKYCGWRVKLTAVTHILELFLTEKLIDMSQKWFFLEDCSKFSRRKDMIGSRIVR